MTYDQLAKRIEEVNLANGWKRPYGFAKAVRDGDLEMTGADVVEHQIAMLALVSTEVSEAIEELRRGRGVEAWTAPHVDEFGKVTTSGLMASWGQPDKPEGVPSELADVVIRVIDFANAWGIDLPAAIASKVDFNASRAHRHGGKRI